MSKHSGFSLIEILLVLALMGLISTVCVIHFDTIQSAFSGENTSPEYVLKKAISQGRLQANQLHKKIDIFITENAIILKDKAEQEIKTFPIKIAEHMLFDFKIVSGELTSEGHFKPSEETLKKIELDEMGFIQSAFVEFNQEEEKQQYEIDVLTGELKPTQW